MGRISDILKLEMTGAFTTGAGNTYYAVKNQPGFNYVMYHGNRYYSKSLTKHAHIDDWLHKSSDETLDVFGNGDGKGIITRVQGHPSVMEVEVFYGSVHHIDER